MIRHVVAIAITITLSTAAVIASAQSSRNSYWGGEHVRMTMTPTGAQLEFDCATGNILEPLPLDSGVEFKLKGNYIPEHGGPIRKGEQSRASEAVYSGRIDGGKMYLTLTISDNQQTFVLERGQSGRIMKCR